MAAARTRLSGFPRPWGRSERRSTSRIGDGVLFGLCALAALLTIAVILDLGYEVVHGASPAISAFGLGFLTHSAWQPNFSVFGAAVFIYGTFVTSAVALLLAAPIGIAIGLFLSMLARPSVRSVIGPLVELLAAIPSVILGFWGLLVLAPFLQRHVEPWLHSHLGFIPLFGPPATTGNSLFTAGLVLTIMVVPIIASLSRDLFLTVPRELTEGAEALGATRWETIRGVVLPSTAPGVIAAAILGLGRALGEAIAVTQVIGAGNFIRHSLFETGDTLASRIASQANQNEVKLQLPAVFYLALILLVIGLVSNGIAQAIARRFATRPVAAR